MNKQAILVSGAVAGALAVAIGAFGAHGLKEILMANGREATFELAVKYQFYHAFALLINGLLTDWFNKARLKVAAVFFISGIVVFSGSLYALSLSGVTLLGAITPVGGLSLIAGWAFMIMGLLSNKKAPSD